MIRHQIIKFQGACILFFSGQPSWIHTVFIFLYTRPPFFRVETGSFDLNIDKPMPPAETRWQNAKPSTGCNIGPTGRTESRRVGGESIGHLVDLCSH